MSIIGKKFGKYNGQILGHNGHKPNHWCFFFKIPFTLSIAMMFIVDMVECEKWVHFTVNAINLFKQAIFSASILFISAYKLVFDIFHSF